MPANVTPEYEKAERRYRPAVSDDERQAALEDMLSTIRNADLVCVVGESGEAALDQIESVLSVLNARGLWLRTAPRDAFSAAQPSHRPGLIVLNKAELVNPEQTYPLRELYADRLEISLVSALTGGGLDDWFERLWSLLAMVRVYSKHPGRPPDLHHPFTLPRGSTVADLARLIHRDLPETMKSARLWGHSRVEGQHVHKTEVLADRDVVEIHE